MCDSSTNRIFTRLVQGALEARDNAYAPYSKFKVGASLVTVSGRVFSGANAETANYKGTCAEAGAIAAMVAAGERKISGIVVVGTGNVECTPCGDCRQRIREFSDATTKIHTIVENGDLVRTLTIEQLLPFSFGPDNLSVVPR